MKIFKYPLKLIPNKQTIELPEGSRILSLQDQMGTLTFWAMVDERLAAEPVSFVVIATGQSLPEGLKNYIGTVQMNSFVWHVFECK